MGTGKGIIGQYAPEGVLGCPKSPIDADGPPLCSATEGGEGARPPSETSVSAIRSLGDGGGMERGRKEKLQGPHSSSATEGNLSARPLLLPSRRRRGEESPRAALSNGGTFGT